MGYILVRYKNSRYRLWDTVVDQWLSPIMNKKDTVNYLMVFLKNTEIEANDWVERKGYTKSHKAWLTKYFDSKTSALTKKHNSNREYFRTYKNIGNKNE